jgi:hypothetical protein
MAGANDWWGWGRLENTRYSNGLHSKINDDICGYHRAKAGHDTEWAGPVYSCGVGEVPSARQAIGTENQVGHLCVHIQRKASNPKKSVPDPWREEGETRLCSPQAWPHTTPRAV